MKWLGRPSPFHLFTNPCVINRFIFGQGVVIYYMSTSLKSIIVYYPSTEAHLCISGSHMLEAQRGSSIGNYFGTSKLKDRLFKLH